MLSSSYSDSQIRNIWAIDSEESGSAETSFVYSAQHCRDPFAEPEEKMDLLKLPERGEQLILKGILSTAERKLAIVAAPTGRTYILGAGFEIAGGSVESVTEQCVILVKTGGRRRLRICADF